MLKVISQQLTRRREREREKKNKPKRFYSSLWVFAEEGELTVNFEKLNLKEKPIFLHQSTVGRLVLYLFNSQENL